MVDAYPYYLYAPQLTFPFLLVICLGKVRCLTFCNPFQPSRSLYIPFIR